MSILMGIIGIVIILAIAFLMSNDRKIINYKGIAVMLVIQLAISAFMMNTSIGRKVLDFITSVFTKILSFGNDGISFVFGDLAGKGIFFIQTLVMIVFVSALLSILNYSRILPFGIKYIGGLVSKITGLPQIESFTAVNAMIFGDTTALIAVKNHIGGLTPNRLFIVTTTSLVSVSCSILGAYMQMIPAEYVLIALPLNVFSGLIVSSIVAPVKVEDENEVDIKAPAKQGTLFEAIGDGALDGGRVALIVAAMLVTYVGLLALVNYVLNGVIGLTVQDILGYIFYPIAFIMGIPADELMRAGGVMGTKVVANEFVAMLDFQKMMPHLSEKTVGIVSAYLISFANFSSIGIVLGTIQAINGEQASRVAKFGLKMLLVATMGSILTGIMVGLFI
ncbi:NupC/NupG family nucleoside CNT transporter [Priestia aryabhattai]|uniref:NupC/NupG family nucleoside CNT transporter n=1 Tax=Priestia aryabhattai TaxID=412384 RepID=UPI003D2B5A76